MAANVAWIRTASGPGARVALGAHHFHLQRVERSMGSYLTARFGRDSVRIVGTATFEGTYLATGPFGLRPYPATAAPPGSIEEMLNRMDMPFNAFDVRGAARDPRSRWLAELHELRQIGTAPREPGFEPMRLADRFDLLLFASRSTAANTREATPAAGR